MNKSRRLLSPSILLTIAILSLAFIGLQNAMRVVAAGTSSETTCDSLLSQLSNDKNYYIFDATATPGNGSKITGYKFDYGDGQSYNFNFNNSSNSNRNSATVRHTYDKTGYYVATASVVTDTNGKAGTTTSANCKGQVTIGNPVVKELANTGPGNLIMLFIGATVIGVILHIGLLKHHKLPL